MGDKNVEHLLPITHLENRFNGDRFGQMGKSQTSDMDYYAQAGLSNNFIFDL